MFITVNIFAGSTICFNLSAEETIGQLKFWIKQVSGIPTEFQCLIFQGQPLTDYDHRQLKTAFTQNELTFNLMPRKGKMSATPYIEVPQWLFLKDEQIKPGFTQVPTHEIAIERIIRGFPQYFVTTDNQSHQPRKKKLILSDFSFSEWKGYVVHGVAKNRVFQQLLRFLLNPNSFSDGIPFEFFVLITPEKTLRKITFKSVDQLYKINEIAPMSSSAIHQIAAQENITSDELLILDYLEVNRLLAKVGILENYKENSIYVIDLLVSRFKLNDIISDWFVQYHDHSSITLVKSQLKNEVCPGFLDFQRNLISQVQSVIPDVLLAEGHTMRESQTEERLKGVLDAEEHRENIEASINNHPLAYSDCVNMPPLIDNRPKKEPTKNSSANPFNSGFGNKPQDFSSSSLNSPQHTDRVSGIPSNVHKAEGHKNSPSSSSPSRHIDHVSDHSSNTKKNEHKISSDTRRKDKTFHLDQFFYAIHGGEDPDVRTYRLNSYNEVHLFDKKTDNAFFSVRNSSEDLQLTLREFPRSNQDASHLLNNDKLNDPRDIFYAKVTLKNLGNTWQPLPSLSADEELIHMGVEGDLDYEVSYSTRDNLYYVKNKGAPQEVTLSYLVAVSPMHYGKNLHIEPDPRLPTEIVKMREQYRGFKEGVVNFKPSGSGQEYIEALIRQQKGSCSHRSAAFLYQMKQRGYACRYIGNDCHSFVEVQLEEQWVRCDLGGYDAKLDINDRHRPQLTHQDHKIPKKPDIVSSKTENDQPTVSEYFSELFKTWVIPKAVPNTITDFCQHLRDLTDKNTLVDFGEASLIAPFVRVFLHHCKQNAREAYYIDSPDDLICQASYLTLNEANEGKMNPGPGGLLHQFLTQNSGHKTLLVVNWVNFSTQEIVKFNSLLDGDEAEIDGVSIPETIRVIGLYHSLSPTAYNGSDFYGRFNQKIKNSLTQEELTKAVAELCDGYIQARDPNKTGKTDAELDQSAHWRSFLLGGWDVHGEQLKFKPGYLLEAIEKGHSRLVINNGPWEDLSFQLFW